MTTPDTVTAPPLASAVPIIPLLRSVSPVSEQLRHQTASRATRDVTDLNYDLSGNQSDVVWIWIKGLIEGPCAIQILSYAAAFVCVPLRHNDWRQDESPHP